MSGEFLPDIASSECFLPLKLGGVSNYTISAVDTVSSIGGGQTRINMVQNYTASYMSVGGLLAISGFTGDWAALNGVHAVANIFDADEFDINVDSAAFAAYAASGYETIWINANDYSSAANYRHTGNSAWFDGLSIHLGRSNQAVDIDDQWLYSYISASELSYGSVTVAPLAYNALLNKVTLQISRDVTNNSGATIDVEEAGLEADINIFPSSNYIGFLFARDLVSFSIPNASIATINYRLITQMDAEGGFTRNFLLGIYNMMTGSSSSITEVNGSTGTLTGSDIPIFGATSTGGNSYPGGSPSGYQGYRIGPRVGTGNTAATYLDSACETYIVHGYDYGQLVTYGSMVQNFNIDSAGGECSLDIVRFFENVDGSAYNNELTVSGGAGTLRVTIDGVNYDQAFTSDADRTAEDWFTTHAPTLALLSNAITATDSGVAKINLLAERGFTVVDNSFGGMSFTQNATRPPITIKEISLDLAADTPPWDDVFCHARFVLAAPVDVEVGELLRLTFTIKILE